MNWKYRKIHKQLYIFSTDHTAAACFPQYNTNMIHNTHPVFTAKRCLNHEEHEGHKDSQEEIFVLFASFVVQQTPLAVGKSKKRIQPGQFQGRRFW